jgi:hypothetical protein
LGAGNGDQQVQAHLHFSSFTDITHTHKDGLSLMLWAFGSEFFTDIGYNKTRYRGYGNSTLSHNTVVMDRVAQKGTDTKGRILFYEPNFHGITVLQVEDCGAYEGKASRYRRTLLLNTRDPDAPYLVDVFEVHGGQMHDYALHGPTLFDASLETDLPVTPVAGERPLLAPGEEWSDDTSLCPYGVFKNVRRAVADKDFHVTFKLLRPFERPEVKLGERSKPAPDTFHYAVDPLNYAKQLELGVQTHFISPPGEAELFLAETPSPTRGGLMGSDLTEKLKRPSLLLRNQGKDGLRSVIIAVHEPFYGKPKITSVKRLQTVGDADSSVALQIGAPGRLDTVLLSLSEYLTVTTDVASLNGRFGFVTKPAMGQGSGCLLGGTALSSGSLRLSAPAATYRGIIEAVSDCWDGARVNAFITTTELPLGDTLKGTWMVVSFGEEGASEAYEIEHVEMKESRTCIVLKDSPGLRIKGGESRETFFPRRQFEGEVRFTIHIRTETK